MLPWTRFPGVDAILFGHSHAEFPSQAFAEHPKVDVARGTINGVAAVMPGRWGDHLGLIDFTLDNAGNRIAESAKDPGEVLRRQLPAIRGAVLIEPPMSADDATPAAPLAFLGEFDRRLAEQGGPAAGEFFLRTVLGEVAFDRIPEPFRERSIARWAEIRADSQALIAYRPRYPELSSIATPVLLLGGDRSAAYFRPTLEALRRSLPNATLEVIRGAGHMLHAEAHRQFAELVTAFAGHCTLAPD